MQRASNLKSRKH